MNDTSLTKTHNQGRFSDLEKCVDCKFEDIPERNGCIIGPEKVLTSKHL